MLSKRILLVLRTTPGESVVLSCINAVVAAYTCPVALFFMNTHGHSVVQGGKKHLHSAGSTLRFLLTGCLDFVAIFLFAAHVALVSRGQPLKHEVRTLEQLAVSLSIERDSSGWCR